MNFVNRVLSRGRRALLGSLPINLVNALIIYIIIVFRAVPIDMSLGGGGGDMSLGGVKQFSGPLNASLRLGPPIICCVLFNLMLCLSVILSLITFSTANSTSILLQMWKQSCSN